MNLKTMLFEDQLDQLTQLTDDVASSTVGLRHKLRSHESNEDTHVTPEQKELWNNKANADDITKGVAKAINEAQDYTNSRVSELDKAISKEYVKPAALDDYAKTTELNAKCTELKTAIDDKLDSTAGISMLMDIETIKADLPLKYYNKTQVDEKVSSITGTDYAIQGFELRGNTLKLTQNPGGEEFDVELPQAITGDAVSHDEFNTTLSNYTKSSDYAKLTFNQGGALLAEYVPNGDDTTINLSGGSTQTYKGSPLIYKGDYTAGTTYYDGTVEVSGVYEQDYVTYNNMYFVCSDYKAGEADGWATTPDNASYFTQMSMSEAQFINILVANKANIKELSSEEVVITDGASIVAGMTSSKAIDSKSDLYGKITTKGDTRIWSGELQKSGDLTSAPTTISSTGVITAQNLTKGNTIQVNPTDATITISVPEAVDDDEHLPTSDARKEVLSMKAYVDPDTLNTGARLNMLGINNIILDPTNTGLVVSEGYSDATGTTGSQVVLDHDDIELRNADGTTVFSATSQTTTGALSTKTVKIGEEGKPQLQYCYDNGSMYLKLNNLATSDPHVAGALYRTSDGTLKVSLG